ncbi:glycosyltransferase family 2 protein [Paenibacillus chitinolyticus]|uniref:glycosyltransferase family 2 protein n=1 Tax=Paenibacillus chitinolyticus TaxID=79263 RepID=UPI00355638E7
MEPIELSVVIPVYNSQDTIGAVVESILHLYNALFSLEIILVNDGSTDASRQECENLSNRYANVVVIHQETNGGQQLALMTGLRRCQGNLVVLMDDDMQNPPSEIIKLIQKVNEGYDVVIGKRMIYNQSLIRKLVSRLNQFLVFVSTKQKISFTNFLIMRRAIVTMIIKDQSPKPVIQGLILRSTANLANTLTEHHQRKNGKSNYNLIKLFKHWLTIVRYYMPPFVKYFLFMLIIIVALGAATGVYFIIDHFRRNWS